MNRISVLLSLLLAFTPALLAADTATDGLHGYIQTVTGRIHPSELGRTTMHEHLFLHFALPLDQPEKWPVAGRNYPDEPAERDFWERPLTIDMLHEIWTGRTFLNRDNLIIDDFDTTVAELQPFVAAGGGAVVDVTSAGLGRVPGKLRRVAEATGLHIVMGAGWYCDAFQPDIVETASTDELATIIVEEIVHGIGPEGIRAGIIGEVCLNGNDQRPLSGTEVKRLRASARASLRTGAAVSLHTWWRPHHEPPPALDILTEEGVDLSRVIVGHAHTIAEDVPLLLSIAGRGAYLQFDLLGLPWVLSPVADDRQVANAIIALIEEGFGDRILLAHDVATKGQLTRWGGHGWGFLLDHFVPYLRSRGVADGDIDRILSVNPARVLTFSAPVSADLDDHLDLDRNIARQ